MFKALALLFVLLAVHCFTAVAIRAQSTEFVYQGTLRDGANPANGSYDFEFRLFDALSGGSQVGSLITRSNVAVAGGIFSVALDFGNNFPGADRFLEIRARNSGGPSLTLLTPRQKLASAPYSIRSFSALNALQLGGVSSNLYTITTDPRLSDPRSPLPDSPNYIQNTGVQQAASNFNISGNGTAGGTLSGGIVNATTQYNLNNARIMHAGPGVESMSVGTGNGPAGTGCCTTLVGHNAGLSLSNGFGSSFYGRSAGKDTTSGTNNSFFGNFVGVNNTTGSENSYFGAAAGVANQTGSNNSYFGVGAGNLIDVGNNNSLLGHSSNAGENLTFASAFGAKASVTQSNSLVLGAINGINSANADTNVGIGTTAPAAKLHISANGGNLIFGNAGCAGLVGIGFASPFDGCSNYAFTGNATDTIINRPTAGRLFFREGNGNQMTIAAGGNVGIGTTAPNDKLDVVGTIGVSTLGAAGATHLCRNASNQISTCSSPRPEPAGETLSGSIEELRTEITALKRANAAQQEQIDKQQVKIQTLLRVVCPQTNEPAVCRP